MQNAKRRSPGAESTNDPISVNSVSNRALRADLVKGIRKTAATPSRQSGLCSRVLRKHEGKAGRHVLGLWIRLLSGLVVGARFGPYDPMVTQYTQGTVVVDRWSIQDQVVSGVDRASPGLG